MNTKKILIVTWITAGILGVIAYGVVFYTSGNYIVKQGNNSPSVPYVPSPVSSSTATSTTSSSTESTNSGSANGDSYISTYSAPPVQWTEGNETMSVTGASLQGGQLTLDLEIDMGSKMECVPMNLRLLVDESGTLSAPVTPQFSFPETGTCQGAPNATYGGQDVVFTIPNTVAFPVFVTTGGSSNLFLQISTTTGNGIIVSPPNQSG